MTKLKPFSGKARKNVKNIFKSIFAQMKLFTKWFLGYLAVKNECSEVLKTTFVSFLQIFK